MKRGRLTVLVGGGRDETDRILTVLVSEEGEIDGAGGWREG